MHNTKIQKIRKRYQKDLRAAINKLKNTYDILERDAEGKKKENCLILIQHLSNKISELKGKIAWSRRMQEYYSQKEWNKHLKKETVGEDTTYELVQKPFEVLKSLHL